MNFQLGRGHETASNGTATLAWRVERHVLSRGQSVLCSSHTMTPLLHHILIALLSLLLPVSAYIPAVPTNDTGLAIQGGLNVTDISRVILQWYSVAG